MSKPKVTWLFRKPYDFHFSIEKVFNGLFAPVSEEFVVDKLEATHYSRGIIPRLQSILALRNVRSAVFHITGDVHFLTFGLPRRSTILTIHDLGMLNHPNVLFRFILWLFWVWLPVRRAKYITTISEESKKDIIKYGRCSGDKVTVVPNYVDPHFQLVKKDFSERYPIILHIGSAPNKNLPRTINAISDIECELWIVGKISSEVKSLLSNVRHKAFYRISDEELKALYEKCDLLSFCSTLEGFGMPILEAQAIGRPVVTSNISSMPEVGGDGACYVDPYDTESIRSGIMRVIRDERYREQLISWGLINVRRFTINQVASSYMRLYRRVLKDNGIES